MSLKLWLDITTILAIVRGQYDRHGFGALRSSFNKGMSSKTRFRAHFDKIPLISLAFQCITDVDVQIVLFRSRILRFWVLDKIQESVF